MQPRQHAEKILKLPTLAERRAYLAEQVPEEWQDLVRSHITSWHDRKKAIERKLNGLK